MRHVTQIFRTIILSLIGGYMLMRLQVNLESSYLSNFLRENLLMLLIALLAINAATLGIVLSKLQEILAVNQSAKFNATKLAMKISVIEQFTLIILSTILLTIDGSSIFKSTWPNASTFIETSLAAIFCYSLYVLYDTSNSVFVLLNKQ